MFAVFFFILSFTPEIFAQNTIGLRIHEPTNQDGYVLFSPMRTNEIFLIDKCGKLVHKWQSSYLPGQSVYLQDDGTLLRAGQVIDPFYNAGGKGGIIELLDWNSNVLWSYKLADYYNCFHHDYKKLPNGNILALVWSEVPMANALSLGRDPSLSSWIWTEKIIEIEPTGTNGGNIVWEWNAFDHLIQDFDNTKNNFGSVSANPQLIDINFTKTDQPNWIHLNSIDYNPILDQIIVSAHKFSEVWIIDHSTSTAEAKTHAGGNSGKGGDIIFRWGNPLAYQRGDSVDQKFFHQHHAQWIQQGFKNENKIIVFNNGKDRPGVDFSSIEIIQPAWDTNSKSYTFSSSTSYLPDTAYWIYNKTIPEEFFSYFISGVQPLDKGGYLICSGASGTFFEIDSLKQTVWEYINPVNHLGYMTQGENLLGNEVFRCTFYPNDFSGFIGKTFLDGAEIEINPSPIPVCEQLNTYELSNNLSIYPIPSSNYFFIGRPFNKNEIEIISPIGKSIDFTILVNENNHTKIEVANHEKGIFLVRFLGKSSHFQAQKIILH